MRSSRKREEQQRFHLDVAHARLVDSVQVGELIFLGVVAEEAVRASLVLIEAVCRYGVARHRGDRVLLSHLLQLTDQRLFGNGRVLLSLLITQDDSQRTLPM